MKKCFNKEFVITKEDNEDFDNSSKWCIHDNDYIDGDVKARNYCYITGKYRSSAHRDCIISVKLNHKIPVVFYNLKNYDSHLIMQELSKFNFKLNVISNELEKYTSFSINKELSFIDSFQFLSSSLDTLLKNLGEDNFKYLRQEFDNNISDLLKQKGFYLYECKQELSSKEKLYSLLAGKNINN